MKPCPKCDQSFETGPELGAHIRAHKDVPKDATSAPYYCFRCDASTESSQEYLEEHAHPLTLEDKQAAYERNVESLRRMGFEPRVDSKGVTGWHKP